jgi:Zn finger protein HypA/HybF involved in hydrogenase expression
MSARLTTGEFLIRAFKVHKLKYTYTKTKYTGMYKKIKIFCTRHKGYFNQVAKDHLMGNGCPKCGGTFKYNTKEFISKAKTVHECKYFYTKTNYIDSKTKIIITCPLHGEFEQTPNHHLLGHGCKRCNKGQLSTGVIFVEKAKKVHGNEYTYKNCEYVSALKKVLVTCKVHGDFAQRPNDHLNGQGCPKCSSIGMSRIAIEWIENYSRSHRLKNVQHAKNGGEFRIPGTRLRVDGFHKASNTVFEFHGSSWHGDPNVFKPKDKCHPFKQNVTAQRLYLKTLDREHMIKKLGYNLITMWESNYK